ncbi:hypothetical protein B0J11DRAFT_535845 [Dendryphion nanum]|uniref:Alginate lyase 2 domain-containing protein n=1 Tax=Dendryphion nanum TaxID=256645 RepID=A0A9P9DH11_9PLEO|nr:hypothetical protein B0J11DRAFT_535845 [Dendryphion nanum]
MSVQVAVRQPDDSKYGTVIGQIKIDDAVSKKPLAELFYNRSGVLTMGVSQIRDVSSLKMTEVGKVDVGTRFGFEMGFEKGVLWVRIAEGKRIELGTGNVGAPKSYFKVGNYNQGDTESVVEIFAIEVLH